MNGGRPAVFEEFGAGDRIRTGDINLGKVALYQLSYSRVPTPIFSRGPRRGVKFQSQLSNPACRSEDLGGH